jgi:hypothetical protein
MTKNIYLVLDNNRNASKLDDFVINIDQFDKRKYNLAIIRLLN